MKTFHDAEARVLEHLKGAGKHTGRLGALLVELADGTRFSVGTGFTDAERAALPPVSAVITFRYQELSDGGVPRFPSYVGVRHDAASDPPMPRVATPAAPVVAPSPAPPASGTRRFEMTEGGSRKFWEVTRSGCEVTVRFGRIGTSGQSKVRTFADEMAARSHAKGLVAEKLGKGYHGAGSE